MTEQLCTPCANSRHEQCWERRGINECDDTCYTADKALVRALSVRRILKGALAQRDAKVQAVRELVEDRTELSVEGVAELKRILGGIYLMPDEEEVPLTAAEAYEEMQRLALEAYGARDGVAFVKEMCAVREKVQQVSPGQGQVHTDEVLRWLEGPQCARLSGLAAPEEGVGQ